TGHPHLDAGAEIDMTVVKGHAGLVDVGPEAALALGPSLLQPEIVTAQHHVPAGAARGAAAPRVAPRAKRTRQYHCFALGSPAPGAGRAVHRACRPAGSTDGRW